MDGGATQTNVYDALNHRVRTVVGSGVTEFVFNQNGQRVSTWKPGYYQLAGQTYWGSKPVEFYAASVANYQHQDWLGTERMRTTYTGAVEGSYQSLPYGDGQTSSGADYDAYHFAALDADYASGTDNAQFRQYSPAQGRWMRPDPYSGSYDPGNPQSFNRYSYVLNNPLAGIDPSGLNCDVGPGCPAAGDCANDPNCYAGDVPGTPGWGGGGVGSLWAQSAQAETDWLGSGSIPWFQMQGGFLMLQIPSTSVWTPNSNYDYDDPLAANGTLSEQANWIQVNADGSITQGPAVPSGGTAQWNASSNGAQPPYNRVGPFDPRWKPNGGYPEPPGAEEARCKGVEKAAEGADMVLTAGGVATGVTALVSGPVAVAPAIFTAGAGVADLFIHGVHFFTCP